MQSTEILCTVFYGVHRWLYHLLLLLLLLSVEVPDHLKANNTAQSMVVRLSLGTDASPLVVECGDDIYSRCSVMGQDEPPLLAGNGSLGDVPAPPYTFRWVGLSLNGTMTVLSEHERLYLPDASQSFIDHPIMTCQATDTRDQSMAEQLLNVQMSEHSLSLSTKTFGLSNPA